METSGRLFYFCDNAVGRLDGRLRGDQLIGKPANPTRREAGFFIFGYLFMEGGGNVRVDRNLN